MGTCFVGVDQWSTRLRLWQPLQTILVCLAAEAVCAHLNNSSRWAYGSRLWHMLSAPLSWGNLFTFWHFPPRKAYSWKQTPPDCILSGSTSVFECLQELSPISRAASVYHQLHLKLFLFHKKVNKYNWEFGLWLWLGRSNCENPR